VPGHIEEYKINMTYQMYIQCLYKLNALNIEDIQQFWQYYRKFMAVTYDHLDLAPAFDHIDNVLLDGSRSRLEVKYIFFVYEKKKLKRIGN
jgi:hypothetical protein